MAMYEIQEIAGSGGMFYFFMSLLVFALYIQFGLPDVNDEENKYLKDFLKLEMKLLLISPLIILAGLGLIYLLSFGTAPPTSILSSAYSILTLYLFPAYMNLPKTNTDNGGIRYGVVSRAIRIGYFVNCISLVFFIWALAGPVTSDFSRGFPVYNFLYQDKPPIPDIRIVDRNTLNAIVDMSQGYLTYHLYTTVHPSVFFVIMFYLSHLVGLADFRASVFMLHGLVELIVKAITWMFGSSQ